MNGMWRRVLALGLCVSILVPPVGEAASQRQSKRPLSPPELSLREYLQKSYQELFELAPTLEFNAAEIEAQRNALKTGKDMCVDRFENHLKHYDKQLEAARSGLKKNTGTLSDTERKQAHCNIQNLDLLKSEAEVLSKQAIPTAYDNLNAKLDVIKLWPAQHQQIQQEVANGSYHTRRWGDVKDIGYRQIEPNQQDDVKRGAQAVEEMKRVGLMPPPVEDKSIQQYVRSVAERIAKHSDLRVPLHVEECFSRARSMPLPCPADTFSSNAGCWRRPRTNPNLPVFWRTKLRTTRPAIATS